MKKDQVKNALESLKSDSKKRKFTQTVDLIINLKDLDLKKPEEQVDLFVRLPKGRGRKVKVCAFVGPELAAEAKKVFDKVILIEQFPGYTDKRKTKKLASEFHYFVAQANIMAKVASTFGRVLGTRGKMPNPKVGCVVPPRGVNLQQLYDQLQRTVKAKAKVGPHMQCAVGSEEMSDDDLAENIMSVYNAVVHKLPNEQHNIKSIYIKRTMSKPVQVS